MSTTQHLDTGLWADPQGVLACADHVPRGHRAQRLWRTPSQHLVNTYRFFRIPLECHACRVERDGEPSRYEGMTL